MSVYGKNGTALTEIYGKDGTELQTAYGKNGVVVYTKESSGAVDYTDYSISDYLQVSLSPIQGFDIYRHIIFQFIGSYPSTEDTMATIDAKTGAFINTNITAVAGHGDSASFSREFYDPNDKFPLLYVSPDNESKIYVNRVTTTSSQLVKTYAFPLSTVGYHIGLSLDDANHIAYILGYTEDNWSDDDGGANKVIVTQWDMTDLTDNGDGTYTPAFITSYERDFIYTIQGQQFHDGMIWLASGGSRVRGYIYALDPSDGSILYTVDTGTIAEVEGLAFLSDTEFIFAIQGGKYRKVTFARAVA